MQILATVAAVVYLYANPDRKESLATVAAAVYANPDHKESLATFALATVAATMYLYRYVNRDHKESFATVAAAVYLYANQNQKSRSCCHCPVFVCGLR